MTPAGVPARVAGLTDLAAPPPRRVVLPDARGRGGLRVSWHAERGVVVFSHWRDDVCIGTTRLPLQRTGELAAFLTAHLSEEARTRAG